MHQLGLLKIPLGRENISMTNDEGDSIERPSGYSIEKIHQHVREASHTNLTDDVTPVTPWQRVQLARHLERPQTCDYIEEIFTGFTELHGDRRFADDPAIITGFARFRDQPCVVIGHQKGRTTKERLHRNFGWPKPEGYRKALRVMKLAEKFDRPIFTFIDTAGAFPGIDAEERGQGEAIAYNLREMSLLRVPIVVTVTGEGGSGGALAIGIGDVILMLENAFYSVISPEGCSSILWRNREHAEEAASILKLTPNDLLEFGLIDRILPEPEGGAHTNHKQMADTLSLYLEEALASLRDISDSERIARRYDKFRAMGESAYSVADA